MRSLSGIKPTGTLHIGNYLGAAKQFVDMQDQYDGYYFIADYHTLNTLPKPEDLRENTIKAVIDYLAFGLDHEKSTIFLQSDVPEVVELAFILSNTTPMGLLQRAHSYKDKIAKGELINLGLFYYPMLMAADILIYDADVVPVGKDQKQHVEIARDIAIKFNQLYGDDLLTVPEPLIKESSAIVPGTDGRKMSKSYGNTIEMFANTKSLKKQVMGIVTDSTPLEDPKNPDTCNVFALYELFASESDVEILRKKYLAGNFGYGYAKKELLDRILEYFNSARNRRDELIKNMDFIDEVLKKGAERARNYASNKVKTIKSAVGLVGNIY